MARVPSGDCEAARALKVRSRESAIGSSRLEAQTPLSFFLNCDSSVDFPNFS
jgi:hypothetical protein